MTFIIQCYHCSSSQEEIGGTQLGDPTTKELKFNPKFEHLFAAEVRRTLIKKRTTNKKKHKHLTIHSSVHASQNRKIFSDIATN